MAATFNIGFDVLLDGDSEDRSIGPSYAMDKTVAGKCAEDAISRLRKSLLGTSWPVDDDGCVTQKVTDILIHSVSVLDHIDLA